RVPDAAQSAGPGRGGGGGSAVAVHRAAAAGRGGAGRRVPVVHELQPALPAHDSIAARAVAAVLALGLVSCARCGGPASAKSGEELLPARADGAVVTAPLGVLGQHLAALADRVASIPGGEQLAQMRAALSAQLGFDPLTREGLLSAGL